MVDRFEALKAFLLALSDDVEETTLRFCIAFKRIKNFACVEFRPTTGKILLFAKVDPKTVTLEPGFTRDVSQVGHFGTGDLEITLTKPEDLEKAMPLLPLRRRGGKVERRIPTSLASMLHSRIRPQANSTSQNPCESAPVLPNANSGSSCATAPW